MNIDNPLLKTTHPASPQSSQGKVLKVILIILAVLAVIIASLLYFTSGLTAAAQEQLAALKSKKIEVAYHMTSSEFQKSTSLDQFKSYVEKNPILENYKSVSFTERSMDNGSGYLSGTIENSDGTQMKIEYRLVKEDNKWKVQAMQLTPLGQ